MASSQQYCECGGRGYCNYCLSYWQRRYGFNALGGNSATHQQSFSADHTYYVGTQNFGEQTYTSADNRANNVPAAQYAASAVASAPTQTPHTGSHASATASRRNQPIAPIREVGPYHWEENTDGKPPTIPDVYPFFREEPAIVWKDFTSPDGDSDAWNGLTAWIDGFRQLSDDEIIARIKSRAKNPVSKADMNKRCKHFALFYLKEMERIDRDVRQILSENNIDIYTCKAFTQPKFLGATVKKVSFIDRGISLKSSDTAIEGIQIVYSCERSKGSDVERVPHQESLTDFLETKTSGSSVQSIQDHLSSPFKRMAILRALRDFVGFGVLIELGFEPLRCWKNGCQLEPNNRNSIPISIDVRSRHLQIAWRCKCSTRENLSPMKNRVSFRRVFEI